ncbi:unnamed protein product, partial [Symbiodinium necroappetens]
RMMEGGEVDLTESPCQFLEPYDPLLLIDPVPFCPEAPGSFPEGAQLVSLCKAWARTVAAERTAFYSALEAEVEPGDLMLGRRRSAKSKRGSPRTSWPSSGSICELLPALSSQLQALSEKQQALEQKVSMGVPPAAPLPAHRQPFALPAAGAPASKAGAMAQLERQERAEPAVPATVVQEPPSPGGMGEILEAGPSPMAAALAQQTEALTQLVGHLIQVSEAELSLQTGNFMLAVAQNGHRRMFPTEAAPKSLEELRREPRRFTFSQYLERKGLWALSLLMVCLEQAALDHGKFEVAYTLLRAFAPLCPPTWATTALAFLKETDSILARRFPRPPTCSLLRSGLSSLPRLLVCCPPPGLEGEGPGLLHRSLASAPVYARPRDRSKGPDAPPAQPPRLTFRRWSLSLFYRAPAKSLFPLPLPYFGIFRALPPHLGSAARSRIGVKRAVFVTNYLYAGLRPPSDLQAKALDYLERLVKACGAVEAVVCQGLTSLGPSFDRYGPAFPGLPLDQQTAFDALHPYRTLDPSRLKLASRANWDPSDFLDDLFYMPFRAPQVLLLPGVGPPGAFEVPDISREVPSRVLALAKLWDSFGLLRLSKDGPETQGWWEGLTTAKSCRKWGVERVCSFVGCFCGASRALHAADISKRFPSDVGFAGAAFRSTRLDPLGVDFQKGLQHVFSGKESDVYDFLCSVEAECSPSFLGDRIVAGFFLVCVYARARFSDALHMEDLKVDRGSGPRLQGYLETSVSRSKTSYTVERKTEYLPMVVPLCGLTGKDWVSEWLTLRTDQEMPSGPGVPLLVMGSKRGGWTRVPPTASFAAAWLRGLLASLEFNDELVTALGTHSCKATCLSWTGTFGISAEHQRVLGYHTAPGDSMRLLYFRDGIAPAVRDLEKVLGMIRSDTFRPDSTRSGYFPGQADEPEIPEVPEDPLLHVPVSESEPSEDEEDNGCDHEAFEMAAEEICDDWQGPAAEDGSARAPMVRHNLSRLIHCLLDDSGNNL